MYPQRVKASGFGLPGAGDGAGEGAAEAARAARMRVSYRCGNRVSALKSFGSKTIWFPYHLVPNPFKPFISKMI